MVERMFLAGIPVRDGLILELARLVDDDELATRLEDCCSRGSDVRAGEPETFYPTLYPPGVISPDPRAPETA